MTMTPEEAVASFLEFTTAPVKASKRLHVGRRDVENAARMKAVADYLERQKRQWPYSGEPYGQTKPPAPPAAEQSVGPATAARRPDPNLISNALLGGTLGGAMLAFGLPSVPLRAGLIGGGATDAALNLPNPEGGSEVSGGLATLGALGKHSVPAMLAAGAAYAKDAEAMPFVKYLKYLKSNRGDIGGTPLFKNPTSSEIGELWKSAREDSFTNDITPTLRIMRDMRTPDVLAWDGTKLLHKDVSDDLGIPAEHLVGTMLERTQNAEAMINYLQGLKPKPKFAGGGAIKRLAKPMRSALSAEGLYTEAPQGALSVVKPKGGNWLAGSVEDALSGLKPPEYVTDDIIRGDVVVPGVNDAVAQRGTAINNWIEGPLTKYVKTRMASPEDEVRTLAEQGVLHFEPHNNPAQRAATMRALSGGSKLGLSDLGRNWENLSDAAVGSGTYQQHLPFDKAFGENREATLRRLGGDFAVANPEATAYTFDYGTRTEDLGFNHLIDELSNALDPNSGLPRHLQLTPEAVKNMSMEKAVRRVADINAWRAAQKVEANRQLAEQASVVREYADNNPKGLRWVELKAPEPKPLDVTPEEVEAHYAAMGPERDKWIAEWRHRRDAFQKNEEGRKILADQLKYEGDTMGHCVGGYCDDVLSGRSRIFSLRDAKGEPHVTVEVAPGRKLSEDDLPDSVRDQLADFEGTQEEFEALVQKALSEQEIKPRVIQIKGKQNKKPNDEYLPFVQDFVRNSPLGSQWSDVGDLQNTGLRRTRDALNNLEQKQLRDKGREFGDYLSDAEIAELQTLFKPGQGFASGGPVRIYPKPTDSPATTGIRGHSPEDVVKQFLSEMI